MIRRKREQLISLVSVFLTQGVECRSSSGDTFCRQLLPSTLVLLVTPRLQTLLGSVLRGDKDCSGLAALQKPPRAVSIPTHIPTNPWKLLEAFSITAGIFLH